MRKCQHVFLFVSIAIVLSTAISCQRSVAEKSNQKSEPNIVLIMCDDMGFSDLGCYGGEINTPNIDALAHQGIRFSQFKNTGRCCPSRASLLTGRYQHAVNMGWMTAVDEHRDGYRGQVSSEVPTIAEILKDNGYSTYLSGKWHVTLGGNYINVDDPKPNGSWPRDRGFDEAYGGLSGGGGYYKVSGLMRNEKHISEFPADYYYTHEITKHAVDFVESHNTNKPLFLYLAHYAPHRPLQAPKDRVEACRETYKVGYDVLRAARYKRLNKLGIIQSESTLPVHQREYNNQRPSWESLSAKKKDAWIKEMATYAAMIEIADEGIGEVIEATKRKGIYDNTIFIFLSDNGATNEGGEISKLAADLSNTPFRYYKAYTYMGGTSSPLIIKSPKYDNMKGELRPTFSHISDLLPTCLNMAGIDYPDSFKGKPISKPDGKSLVPIIEKKDFPSRDLFFEHQSSCAIISDHYKLVKAHDSLAWELIDLKTDPFELSDISKQFPEKVNELKRKWNKWAEQNNVLPLEGKSWNERINHYKAIYPDQTGN